jgi:hypothetical protein
MAGKYAPQILKTTILGSEQEITKTGRQSDNTPESPQAHNKMSLSEASDFTAYFCLSFDLIRGMQNLLSLP